MSGMDRPFLHKSIDELEALFVRFCDDEKRISQIADELEFRHTSKAATLSDQINAKLYGIRQERLTTRSMEMASSHKDHEPPPHRPIPQDAPESLLSAWIAFEALAPQTYRRPEDLANGDKRCVAKISYGSLPWEKKEKSLPKKNLFYQITLGSISMAQATEALIKVFGDNEEELRRPPAREKAAIAAIVVDSNGIIVGEKSTAISSFAWALHYALQRRLDALADWPSLESELVSKLEDFFQHYDKNEKILPVNSKMISAAWAWLQKEFSLVPEMVEGPNFAVRIYQSFKIKTPPEASLLNSFFLHDLSLVLSQVKKGNIPFILKQYLGLSKPENIQNLFTSQSALEQAVAPQNIPTARWPSKGGHPLVLLQQAAVNLARKELLNKEGLLAVNGPPGTGKTTLLRDIIASVVTDRACAMATFDDPSKAFRSTGHKLPAGDHGFFHLYALNQSLKGHELLVASSNNKAVENVSKELPASEAIGRNDELQYFKSISNTIFNRKYDEGEGDAEKETVDTWGLIAAVLGNSKNRYYFQQSFWWDEDYAFRYYLKVARGDGKIVKEIKDPQSGKVIAEATPQIILTEQPPTPQEARANWLQARVRFLNQKKDIEEELSTLETLRENCLKLSTLRQELSEKQVALSSIEEKRQYIKSQYHAYEQALTFLQREKDIQKNKIEMHVQNKPFFLAMLFNTKKAKGWRSTFHQLLNEKNALLLRLNEAEQEREETTQQLTFVSLGYQQATKKVAELEQELTQLSEEIEGKRELLDYRMVDNHFFEQNHGDLHKTSPWVSSALHRKREELFIAAMDLHKAFIGASAQKILHNLSILMDVFSGKVLEDDGKRQFLGDLWSTLFLVIPVLSTTFASVDRMLGQLPEGAIGWLLVDEAGQALPQAAVGAMLRSKRAIVVGDPLQIPPVVSLPEKLINKISIFFGIDKTLWAAPQASVQMLADRATRYQTSFNSDKGPRRVGLPLLVHRRCQQPMFDISNHIAYDNQMVHAPGPANPGATGEILGHSQWFDVTSDAESKWSPQEGDFVVSLLNKIAERGVTNPDIFLITPFRQVAGELRKRLEHEFQLFKTFGVEADEWLKDRVGTIHTVQGREAESVVLILGAPGQKHAGARNWAASTPNILNVAASRAKQNLYVVGSWKAWAGTGHAVIMANNLVSHKTNI
ncbi:DEAD/DEAH box helicase [Brenneria tiliae]|uniref:AAA domain-containing protein n=1 Tax=Brenneria tiliae TaxID=2914984 RepID=A0ABT0MSJ5_9GAMM|nr:AAA domain-containing protein [Brenneria tiliae]MCL2892825.1 AAA domain-containing protein [Brenneria tiliae]